MEIVPLNGPIDYRYDRLKGAETYFSPVNEVTTAALSAIFFRLTDRRIEDRDKVPSGELIVQGRHLFVPKSARGVAVFFIQTPLCESAWHRRLYCHCARLSHRHYGRNSAVYAGKTPTKPPDLFTLLTPYTNIM